MQKIRDMMNRKVITAGPTYSLFYIVELMRTYRIGSIIITDSEKKPIGIITESDILKTLHANAGSIADKSAADCMTSPVIYLNPDDTDENASLVMSNNRIRRAPVMENGNLAGILSYRDLTVDLRKTYYILDEIIEEKANKDPLTGLYNKGYGKEQLLYHMKLAERMKILMAVCIFDLDHFKNINDTYGHLCGDRVLKTAGHVIRDCARTVDVVSRYGGEEFMITGFIADPDSALILPERVRKLIEKLEFYYEGRSIGITISCGVAISGEGIKTGDDFIKKADAALYEAKDKGRNRVVLSAN